MSDRTEVLIVPFPYVDGLIWILIGGMYIRSKIRVDMISDTRVSEVIRNG